MKTGPKKAARGFQPVTPGGPHKLLVTFFYL
jgi:hypothetical protein